MTWQQGGTKVSRTWKSLTFFDSQFGKRIIAMDSYQGHDWPTRSPDCNHLDFFCWGYLKSIVFSHKSAIMAELKTWISQDMARLDPAMIRT